MDLSELNRTIAATYPGLEAAFNDENGEIELFHFKTVIDDGKTHAADAARHIALSEARLHDPGAMIGDELGLKITEAIPTLILARVKKAKDELIYRRFLPQVGALFTVTVIDKSFDDLIVDLDGFRATIRKWDLIRGEYIAQGSQISACLTNVGLASDGLKLHLSRTAPEFLQRLFEDEIPEIKQGLVKIMAVARDPGARAKLAVKSISDDVDPVGACIGLRGARIRAVSRHLLNERVEIVEWSDDPIELVRAALAPAQVSQIEHDELNHVLNIIVPSNKMASVIGKGGQNVRLAAQLTGLKIAVLPTEARQAA